MIRTDIETYNKNKPSYRGVVHTYAFYASLPAAAYLIYRSPEGQALWPLVLYAVCLILLFGISALYHRIDWQQVSHSRMGTLDRVMIYIFIAANFTPFAVLAMDGALSTVLLSVLWGAVAMGLVVNLFWLDSPNWVHSSLYVLVSGAVLFAVPELWETLGPWAIFWIFLGGVIHVVGAMIYASQFPNPSPRKFGFHEIFHVFVTVAIATHYGVVAVYLTPVA